MRVEKHLSNELDIMETIFQMSGDDIKSFYKWYMDHPYRKGIEEIQNVIRRGTNKETASVR